MKIIVADKISERGLKLLREKGWNVVTPAAPALATELADAEALVRDAGLDPPTRAEQLSVADFAAPADYADCDSAAVCDQEFFEHRPCRLIRLRES